MKFRKTMMAFASAALGMSVIVASGNTMLAHADTVQTIRFTVWYGNGDIPVWKKIVQDFEAANPDIKVDFEPVAWGQYWTKLNTELAANDAPDVLGMNVGLVYKYIQDGSLVPLNSYIKAAGLNPNEIPSSLLKDGQLPTGPKDQYTLPFRFVGKVLYVNLTAFKKAGIPYPSKGWTLSQFLAAAKKLTNAKQWGTDANVFATSPGLMADFHAEPLTPDNKTAKFNTPQMLNFYNFLHDLIYKYKVSPNPKAISTKVDEFASGQAAMYWAGSWQIPIYRQIKNFQWDIAPLPSEAGVNPPTYCGPDMLSINNASPNKDAAFKFIRYVVFNKKAQQTMSVTGLPVLTNEIYDSQALKSAAAAKPAHYKQVLIDGAVKNGAPYMFVKSIMDAGTDQSNTDYQILTNPKPNPSIATQLSQLNSQITALLNSNNN